MEARYLIREVGGKRFSTGLPPLSDDTLLETLEVRSMFRRLGIPDTECGVKLVDGKIVWVDPTKV